VCVGGGGGGLGQFADIQHYMARDKERKLKKKMRTEKQWRGRKAQAEAVMVVDRVGVTTGSW